MFGPSRFICSVLEEMRTCIKTLNFAALLSLIEECQTLANRMEAAIDDNGGAEYIVENLRELKKEKKGLEKEISLLKNEKDLLEETSEKGGMKKKAENPHRGSYFDEFMKKIGR